MTHARARLWLGITGVGSWVLLATGALALGWPARLLPAEPASLAAELAALSAVLGFYLLVSLPLDLLGGLLVPRRHGRFSGSYATWARRWSRAAAVQLVVMLAIATGLLAAGRAGGLPAALGAVALAMLLLAAFQDTLARAAGNRRVQATLPERVEAELARLEREGFVLPRERLVVLDEEDPSFVGGWAGLPGVERLVLPARWLRTLAPDALALQVARRAAALQSGSRTRGLLLALGFNLLGFGLAAAVPGAGVTSVAGLVTTALAFTLWSFVGLLLLPTPSRLGVHEADLAAARLGFAPELFRSTIARLDAEQDDEPERPPAVETIFHPVPSVASRVARLQAPGRPARGAWQAARQALYLSWAGWSFLPRAVHCNSGRPGLWVLYPGD